MNGLGKLSVFIAVFIILATGAAFGFSFIYDKIFHPHDMNLPGLLAVILLMFGCPIAVIIGVIGLCLIMLSRD